jgi:hypothetical protein
LWYSAIKRELDWDEYDGLLVLADSLDEAHRITAEVVRCAGQSVDDFSTEEVRLDTAMESRVLMASFNAG